MLLPAGLSFLLLQSIGYVIDVHRGTVPREKSLLAHAAFVSFFPRLLAGPIERAGNLLPQLRTSVPVTLRDFTDGLSIFVVGYFKKVALADYLALYVAKVYATPGEFRAPALILATFLFAWQIYFDFSGYTDMARASPDDGHSPDAELRQPVPGGEHGRFLEALAYQPVVLVPRLRLYSARRQSQRQSGHVSERLSDDGALGPLARSGVDLRPLGRGACSGQLCDA
jgi:hypothetical protein